MSVTFKTGPNVTLNYSADDWQLYDMPGRDNIASKLNHGMEVRIHVAPTRRDFKLGNLLDTYAVYGARDSEGFHMVEHILDRVYGERE
jgi:hypothetical protein